MPSQSRFSPKKFGWREYRQSPVLIYERCPSLWCAAFHTDFWWSAVISVSSPAAHTAAPATSLAPEGESTCAVKASQ